MKTKLIYLSFRVQCAMLRIRHRGRLLFLIGTPAHGNLGDHAIAYAEELFLKDRFPRYAVIEIYSGFFVQNHSRLPQLLQGNLICIHGGGFMGTLWPQEEEMLRLVIETFPQNRIIVFPQTIYYEDSPWGRSELAKSQKIYGGHRDLHLCAREKASYAFMKAAYPKSDILLVPDMVLYLNRAEPKLCRNGVLLCFRKDKECTLTGRERDLLARLAKEYSDHVAYTDTVLPFFIDRKQRERVLAEKLDEFRKAELVVTDRLHGMIFAAVTETPCIVLDNCSHKVRGVYEWIGQLPYIRYAANAEEAGSCAQSLRALRDCKFDNGGFLSCYDKIADLIKNTDWAKS